MTLKDFWRTLKIIDLDFGDVGEVYHDYCDYNSKESLRSILDEDSYDCFCDIVDYHPNELEYYGCRVIASRIAGTLMSRLCIYVDLNEAEALVDRYYPE